MQEVRREEIFHCGFSFAEFVSSLDCTLYEGQKSQNPHTPACCGQATPAYAALGDVIVCWRHNLARLPRANRNPRTLLPHPIPTHLRRLTSSRFRKNKNLYSSRPSWRYDE